MTKTFHPPHVVSRPSRRRRSRSLGRLAVPLWCLFTTPGCSDPYEAEGQFWNQTPGLRTEGSGGSTAPTSGGTAGAIAEGGYAPVLPAAGNAGSGVAAGGFTGGTGGSTGVGEMAGSSGAGGAKAPAVASENCTLSVTVKTSDVGGKYRPANIGAIWLADEDGNFLRTLEVWAERRLKHLNYWIDASTDAGAPKSRVDIVSQATYSKQKGHVEHTVNWGCRDHAGALVPDGNYRVYFEVTDKDARGASHFETFTKNGVASTSTPPGSTNFHDIKLVYTP